MRPEEADVGEVDPGRVRPGYWTRFQTRTMSLVEPELARRRRVRDRVTISDVVTSWSRTVVPLAMAAAAAALMVLLGDLQASDSTADEAADIAVELVLDGGPIAPPAQPEDLPVILTAVVEGF